MKFKLRSKADLKINFLRNQILDRKYFCYNKRTNDAFLFRFTSFVLRGGAAAIQVKTFSKNLRQILIHPFKIHSPPPLPAPLKFHLQSDSICKAILLP